MHNQIIKVGFCVAYDWQLLKISVPLVYEHADMICFSIDKNRHTWSGKPYLFDETEFLSWIKEVDIENKIIIYEGIFSDTSLGPLQNDNLQRNEMAAAMGPDGWHIQIDADEYVLDFKGFCDYLKQIDPNPVTGKKKALNVCLNLIPLIKKVTDGYLAAGAEDDKYEVAPFATNVPEYHAARRNGHFNKIAPYFALHETWARDENVLLEKINNWGHRDDFDKESYFNLWKSLDQFNIKHIKNFHPIKGNVWPYLVFLPGTNQNELINTAKNKQFKVNKARLRWINNRIIQGIRQRLRLG